MKHQQLFLSRELAAALTANRGLIRPVPMALGDRKAGRVGPLLNVFGEPMGRGVADTLYFGAEMTSIKSNQGGGVQASITPAQSGGKEMCAVATFTYAAQAAGSTIWLARLPLPCRLTQVELLTDTSTSTATLAFGDAHTAALIAAAAAYTTTDTPTLIGKTSAFSADLTAGYDAQTGNAVTYTSNQGFGGLYDDIIATTATASLPASGTLVVKFRYVQAF